MLAEVKRLFGWVQSSHQLLATEEIIFPWGYLLLVDSSDSHVHACAHLLGCLLQVAHPVKIPSPGVYNQRGFVCGQLGRCVLKSFVHIYCYLFCKLKMEMYFKSLFCIQLVIVLRLIKWDHGVLGVFPMDSPFRTLHPQDPSGASHYRSL